MPPENEPRAAKTGTDRTVVLTVPPLESLRRLIDDLDQATAGLLVQRTRCARRIALLKLLRGQPRRDPERELLIRRRYAEILSAAGWSPATVDPWLRPMLYGSGQLQEQVTVAVDAGPGSWGELSLQEVLPSVRVHHAEGPDAAWAACRAGRVDAAWLPTRNTALGALPAAEPLLQNAESWVEVHFPTRPTLWGSAGLELPAVRRVLGDPLTLSLCRATLARLLPDAETVRMSLAEDNVAAEAVRPGTGVVGAEALGERLGLTALRPDVADDAANRTVYQLVVPKRAILDRGPLSGGPPSDGRVGGWAR